MISRISWVIGLALMARGSFAQVIIDPVPGGIIEIPIAEARARPEVYFGGFRTLVHESGNRWSAVVGLSIDISPGNYVLEARLPDDDKPILKVFRVHPRRLPKTPSVSTHEWKGEFKRVRPDWRDALDAELPLSPPVTGDPAANYGAILIGDQAVRYSDFLTYGVARDTDVRAPGSGVVLALSPDTHSESGGYTLWLDHGMNLTSRIGPVSSVSVEPGQALSRGQVLGEINIRTLKKKAQTHNLNWAVLLNHAAVDPRLVTDFSESPLPLAQEE